MAYITGLAIEPVFDEYVEIENECLEKPTPKHVALAMTVRYWTGSARANDFLNGLGHSVSSLYVLQHDTALANKQLERKTLTVTPEGFDKKQVHHSCI